jgi:hypothetical protein
VESSETAKRDIHVFDIQTSWFEKKRVAESPLSRSHCQKYAITPTNNPAGDQVAIKADINVSHRSHQQRVASIYNPPRL